MILEEMYQGKVNSPDTKIINSINAADTTITVENISVFPPAPNLAVLGLDGNAETIKYSAINGNMLVGCERGFQGIARSWEADTVISRNFTEADQYAIQENIKKINIIKLEEESVVKLTALDQVEVIGAEDNLQTVISKIVKYLNELKSVALSGASKDLVTDEHNQLVSKVEKDNWDAKTTNMQVVNLIDDAVAKLINNAPEALDTLEELSNALGNDPNFATTVATQIGLKVSTSDFNEVVENINNSISNVMESLKGYAKTSDIPDVSGFETKENVKTGLESKVSTNDIANTWDTAVNGKVLDAGLGKELFQSGIERNVELVGQLNSKGVEATTDISLKDNISKVGDISTGYERGDVLSTQDFIETRISVDLVNHVIEEKNIDKVLGTNVHTCVTTTINNDIYFVIGSTLFQYDSKLIKKKEQSTNINANSSAIFTRNDDRIIITFSNGTMQMYDTSLNLIKTVSPTDSSLYLESAIDKLGNIFTFNSNKELFKYDNNLNLIKKIQVPFIYHLTVDNKNRVPIVGMNDNLTLYDNNLNYLGETPRHSKTILCVIGDMSNRIILIDYSTGVFIYDENLKPINKYQFSSLTDRPQGLLSDSQSNILFYDEIGNVAVIDKNLNVKDTKKLNTSLLKGLTVDKDDRIIGISVDTPMIVRWQRTRFEKAIEILKDKGEI